MHLSQLNSPSKTRSRVPKAQRPSVKGAQLPWCFSVAPGLGFSLHKPPRSPAPILCFCPSCFPEVTHHSSVPSPAASQFPACPHGSCHSQAKERWPRCPVLQLLNSVFRHRWKGVSVVWHGVGRHEEPADLRPPLTSPAHQPHSQGLSGPRPGLT